ncbi:MAG: hypothetical protein M3O30_11195 [Planctomycetota bacterium]|nr:hypothetical protein [Planctomycetota bacterium]
MQEAKRARESENLSRQSIALASLFDSVNLIELPWQPLREGVHVYPIYGKPGVCPAAALVKYPASTALPFHPRSTWEQVVVLRREQIDRNGTTVLREPTINALVGRHERLIAFGGVALVIWEDLTRSEPGAHLPLAASE